MKPGTIVWVDLDPVVGHEQAKTRPCLILAGPVGTLIIIVPVTSAPPKVPFHVALYGGSTALCEQVRSVSRDRVRGTVGSTSPEDLHEVRQVVGTLIGL